HEEGIVESSEKDMIENVFDLTDSKASDIMTPRTSIVAVPIDITYDDLLNMVKDTHFSRLPVVGENIDDIVGLLYVKDLVGQKK
ncbi:CBS domain-containing protein, partial [Salmonella enterica]